MRPLRTCSCRAFEPSADGSAPASTPNVDDLIPDLAVISAPRHNYATHKHPKVHAWVERDPRFHFHFTPTSASWLNAVVGFFAKLTRQRLKRGVFTGIVDLQAAINRFLVETNQNPKPFTRTADPDAIIEKVRRGKLALNDFGMA